MKRAIQHLIDVASLDDPTGVHHGNFIRKTSDDRQIMGDPYKRRSGIAAQFLGKGKDLRLQCHIQCRRRFVGDDQVRPVQHGDGDANTLSHPSG